MNSVWQAFIAQARAVFGDKGALLLFIAAPLLYSAFYPLPYLNHVVRAVPIGVVDLDQSAQSRQIGRWLSAHPNVTTRAFVDTATAEAALRDGELGGFVILPAGLARDVALGRSATVPVIADAAYFLVYRQVLTAALEAAGTFGAQVQVARGMVAGKPLYQALADRDPHPLVVRPVFNRTESYLPYIVPGVYILILQQTMLMGLALLAGTAREAGEGGARHPNRNGARHLGIGGSMAALTGRTLFLCALYGAHALYFWGWSTRLFDLPAGGQTVHLFWLLIPFLLAVSLLGIALQPLFKEREQAFAYLLFTSLPILFISGFVWPREAMPDWMPVVAAIFPTTPAIEGFLALLSMDAPWATVVPQALHLWLLVGVFAIPALWVQSGWGSGATQAGIEDRSECSDDHPASEA